MAKLPRYTEQGRSSKLFLPSSGGDGSAQLLGEIASSTSQLSSRLGSMADQAAKKEGHQAGLVAGLDREFQPVRDNTIRGDAYDRAGISSRLDLTEAETRQELEELAVQFPGQPEQLAAAIAKYSDEKINQVDGDGSLPELRVAISSLISRTEITLVRDAIRAGDAVEQDQRRAMMEAGIRTATDALGRAAYTNGLDEGSDEVITGEIASLQRTLQGAVDNGDMSHVTAGRMLDAIMEDTAATRVMGTLERIGDPAAKQEFLDGIKKQYAAGSGPMAEFSPERFSKLKRAIEVSIEQGQRAAIAAGKEINRAWQTMEDGAYTGLPPSPEDIERQMMLAEKTNNANIMARAEQARANIRLGEDLQTRTPIELERMSQQLQNKASTTGVNESERDRLKIVGKIQTAMNRQLKNDPYTWGVRAGILDEAPAITFGGDEATISSLQARRQAHGTMEGRYGKVPFFTSGEKSALTYIAGKGGEQMLNVSKAIVAALGNDAHVVLGEISNEAPVLANLAGLANATGNDQLAAEASAALLLKQDENFKPVKFNTGQVTQASAEFLGRAYAGNPLTQSAVLQTAQILFEKRVMELGLEPDFEDSPQTRELWERTIDEAAGARFVGGVKHGGLDIVNGGKTIAPSSMAQGELESRLQSISDDDLAALAPQQSANSLPIKARQMQNARLVAIGDGRYRVALGDPGSAQPDYVMTKTDFWILDANLLKQIQGNRIMGTINMPGGGGY